MEYLIREQQTIATPNVSELLLSEAYKNQKKKANSKLIVQIESIHEGITKNFNKYIGEELEKATTSWLMPYPRPILLNHNLDSEPLGRMVNSEYKKNSEGTGFIQLRAHIADPVAAAKVIDGRYLTGSVGGVPKAAICSICFQDVISASREGTRCDHMRGDIYDEKVCVYEHRDIEFHEYSFVNVPGDTQSQIQSHIGESVYAEMAVYAVDFDTKVVKEYRPALGAIDIRELMTESAAEKTYLDLAFGSKHADLYMQEEKAKNIMFNQNISTIEEESGTAGLEQGLMTDKNQVDQVAENDDEDVLDVADRLAAELSETAPVEEASADEEEIVDAIAEEDATETPEVEEAEAATDEEVTATEGEDTDLATEAEATEEVVEEEVEETDAEAVTEEEDATEAEEVVEAEQEDVLPDAPDADENAPAETDATALQDRISELEAENEKLRDQNTKMKSALHAELAEKVVDARIAVGHIQESDREAALTEHKARTASSLADALVDIRSYAEKNNYQVRVVNGTVPSLEIRAEATSEADKSVLLDEDETIVAEEVAVDPADLLVENLTGLLLNGVEKTLRKHSN